MTPENSLSVSLVAGGVRGSCRLTDNFISSLEKCNNVKNVEMLLSLF